MCKICEGFEDVIKEVHKAWAAHKQYAHNENQQELFKESPSEIVDPNPQIKCMACWQKRRHTDEEWKENHVLARTGISDDRKLAGG